MDQHPSDEQLTLRPGKVISISMISFSLPLFALGLFSLGQASYGVY
jgi:hypothetical protein